MKVDVGRQFTELELEQAERSAKSATAGMSAAARAEVVNRTHRVVRERASKIQNQRSKMRSLWIPLAVSASLMVVLVFAVWSAVSDFEADTVGPAGEQPDAGAVDVVGADFGDGAGGGVVPAFALRNGE